MVLQHFRDLAEGEVFAIFERQEKDGAMLYLKTGYGTAQQVCGVDPQKRIVTNHASHILALDMWVFKIRKACLTTE